MPPSPVLRRADEDADDRHRQTGLITASSILVAIAVLFVALRTVSRVCILRKPGVDDYLLVVSAVLLCGLLVCLGVGVANRTGFPAARLSTQNLVALSKATLAIEVFYYLNLCTIKVSIVLTYLRFALSPVLRRLCYATVVFHAALCVSSLVVVFLQCRPLAQMWNFEGDFAGYAVNITAFFFATAGINFATDFWILLLPVPTLARVRRPPAQKLALFSLFGAGLFASAASVVRLYAIHTYGAAADHLHDSVFLNLWNVIEQSVGLCCASVTGMRPLLRGWGWWRSPAASSAPAPAALPAAAAAEARQPGAMASLGRDWSVGAGAARFVVSSRGGMSAGTPTEVTETRTQNGWPPEGRCEGCEGEGREGPRPRDSGYGGGQPDPFDNDNGRLPAPPAAVPPASIGLPRPRWRRR